MNIPRTVIAVQGAYYVATGLWPLVHMPSFEAMTGPKTDHWLVNTVGLLAMAIGITLLSGARASVPSRETRVAAICAAIAFAAVDIFYSLTGTISRIYLFDSVIQLIIVAILAIDWLLSSAAAPDIRRSA